MKQNPASKNSLTKVGLIAREFHKNPAAYLFPKSNPHMQLAIDNFVYDLVKEFDIEVENKRRQYIEQEKLNAKARRGGK